MKDYSWGVAMEAFSINFLTTVEDHFYINSMCKDCFGAAKAFFELRKNLSLRR